MLLPHSQKGVALITALLIVALATVVIVELSTRLQLDIRRTSNIIASDQAMSYMIEAEHWSRRILRDDRLNSTYDSLDEDWAMEIPPLPVEGGSIQGKLSDLQACFNLNSLVQNNQPNALAQGRFRRLMQALPNPPATDLSPAIIDWIDADVNNNTPADGAEDSYYHNLEKPYRSANQAIRSISELRLIKGFEEDAIIQETEGLLCAFGLAAPINVNTAPVEVLQSLSANITATVVTEIIDQSHTDPYEPYETVPEFISRHNLTGIVDPNGLSPSSEYFLLETKANIGQARTLMYSIIHRENNGDTQVIARSQGAY